MCKFAGGRLGRGAFRADDEEGVDLEGLLLEGAHAEAPADGLAEPPRGPGVAALPAHKALRADDGQGCDGGRGGRSLEKG